MKKKNMEALTNVYIWVLFIMILVILIGRDGEEESNNSNPAKNKRTDTTH